MKNVEIKAYFAVNSANKTKAQVARELNVSPRTVGRYIDKVNDMRREQVVAKLESQFAGKVQRRAKYVYNNPKKAA
ncbi:hypothetical protein AsFcp4_59 [Aeromonas phage AsFcp_4]|uniref:Uncharacterized protein n=1 Tax=Aeromonas phage PX29 TaxID=926067 RepID=E5DQG0_9CAUD|nr:hypothetical protein CL89_gp251 [Aeromonas phage PX29]ADQ52946.1 conserved hypothetical protein [Aeromonas phage PX29]QAX98484.1 hypothetical protein ASfcp2_146 [Aeromonas phage AsFcp_2]QAX99516.1 hypothetical protein AsFcp4_59 [Aeromonas phage AsFcp_4]